jgi:hypothetical protein
MIIPWTFHPKCAWSQITRGGGTSPASRSSLRSRGSLFLLTPYCFDAALLGINYTRRSTRMASFGCRPSCLYGYRIHDQGLRSGLLYSSSSRTPPAETYTTFTAPGQIHYHTRKAAARVIASTLRLSVGSEISDGRRRRVRTSTRLI